MRLVIISIRNSTKIQLCVLLFVIGLVTSCKKEDDNDVKLLVNAPTCTFNLNGAPILADSVNAYYRIDSSLGITLRSFLVEAGFGGGLYLLPGFIDTINSTDFSNIYYPSILSSSGPAGASLGYFIENDTINTYFAYHENAASFKITKTDSINKIISGTFYGIVVNDSLQDTVHITNGVFTDVPYKSIN